VSADHGDLDQPLHDAVHTWLKTSWPFATVDYAAR
jgi:hypothetical protein